VSNTHPVAGSHESTVHTLPSSHTTGAPVHVVFGPPPTTWHVSPEVQKFASVHAVPTAFDVSPGHSFTAPVVSTTITWQLALSFAPDPVQLDPHATSF
jgi:hypothetical protein